MPALLLSTWSLPSSQALAEAAGSMGWHTSACDENLVIEPGSRLVFYGGTDQPSPLRRGSSSHCWSRRSICLPGCRWNSVAGLSNTPVSATLAG